MYYELDLLSRGNALYHVSVPGTDHPHISLDFIERIAIKYSADYTAVIEKVTYMLNNESCTDLKTAEETYKWIEDNWDHYQLVSF